MTEEEKELPFEEFEGGYVIPEAQAKALWEGARGVLDLIGDSQLDVTGLGDPSRRLEKAINLLKKGIGE